MQNLLDPAILFFVFGVFAGAVRSNLEIPPAIAKFLSLYLLMALGLKGGFAVSRFDAAAVAASYGSVSAVTFVTAMQFLESNQLAYGGHMAAAMVIMESPAILIAVLLANSLRQHAAAAAPGGGVASGGAAALAGGPGAGGGPGLSLRKVLHESFTDGAQMLLLGAMVVGYVTGDTGKAVMQPFSGDLFKGMLAFFLLDMGLMVARNFSSVRGKSPVLVAYAAVAPFVHASIALGLAKLLGMAAPDAALLMVLSASASYIVVPAVLRYAVPEANPSLYFGLSLGVTFPINMLIGIPLYTSMAVRVLG
jgi:hypothetical protein